MKEKSRKHTKKWTAFAGWCDPSTSELNMVCTSLSPAVQPWVPAWWRLVAVWYEATRDSFPLQEVVPGLRGLSSWGASVLKAWMLAGAACSFLHLAKTSGVGTAHTGSSLPEAASTDHQPRPEPASLASSFRMAWHQGNQKWPPDLFARAPAPESTREVGEPPAEQPEVLCWHFVAGNRLWPCTMSPNPVGAPFPTLLKSLQSIACSDFTSPGYFSPLYASV